LGAQKFSEITIQIIVTLFRTPGVVLFWCSLCLEC